MVVWIPVTEEEAAAFLHSVSLRNGSKEDAVVGASKAMTAIEATSAESACFDEDEDEIAKFLVPLTMPSTTLLPPHTKYCNDMIPVIDLSSLSDREVSGQDDAAAAIAALMFQAATIWGVFQVVNHGLPTSVLEGAMEVTREFFDMPEEEKQAYALDYENGCLQGYRSTLESLHMTRNLGSQLEYILQPESLSIIKDDWPSKPAAYKNVIDEFGKGVYKLLARIAELLLTQLGIATTSKTSENLLKGDLIQSLRLGYYEPCLQPEIVLGHIPHLDQVLLTAVVQDDKSEGLQVKKNGEWFKVASIPGAIVILIGTQIQVTTNDNLKAVEHRVVLNPHSSRISIASGLSPSLDALVSTAMELVDDNHPAHYHPYVYSDFRLAQLQKHLSGEDVLEQFRTELAEASYPASTAPTKLCLNTPQNVNVTIMKPNNPNPNSNHLELQTYQDFDFKEPIFYKQGALILA